MTDVPRQPPGPGEPIAQEKRRTLLDFLDRDEGLVALHLDARHPGVAVPPHLLGEPALRLDIAYGFNLPRLEIDEEGVDAVLSFSGRNFACFLPWDAIFAMSRPLHEGEGFVWPPSMPPELLAAVEAKGPAPGDAVPAPEPPPAAETASAKRPPLVTIPPAPGDDPAQRPRPGLRLADAPSPDDEAAPSEEDAAPTPARPRGRPALRLVRGDE